MITCGGISDDEVDFSLPQNPAQISLKTEVHDRCNPFLEKLCSWRNSRN